MKLEKHILFFLLLVIFKTSHLLSVEGLPLYYWRQPHFTNFGDYLSLKIVEKIVGCPVEIYKKKMFSRDKKLLAIGSILYFAEDDDVVWGSGTNGKKPNKEDYSFTKLDIRSVRGPLTRKFLKDNWDIECNEIYGDPALLLPYLYPELKRKENPKYPFLVISHYSDVKILPKSQNYEVVHATEELFSVIDKILDSEFVISSSLHGIIIAEAFGIPARYLRVSEGEPLLKFEDYYLGTCRDNFKYATSINEALLMGGEAPFKCDLKKLYEAFPFEYWPNQTFPKLIFNP